MTLAIDEKEIEHLIADIGMDDFKTLLEAFFSECGDKLNSLERNSSAADHQLLELDAHTLKSLSRTFGALKLGEACAKLERAAKDKDPEHYFQLFEDIKIASHEAIDALRQKYG